MSRTYWTLAGLYLAVMAATLTGVAFTEKPTEKSTSLAIVSIGVVIMIALYVALVRVGRRDQAARKTKAADPEYDPWVPVVEGIRKTPTGELIVMWNNSTTYANTGTAIQLDSIIRPVVVEELTARKIPLCRCGAPLPDGTHTLTCQEFPA